MGFSNIKSKLLLFFNHKISSSIPYFSGRTHLIQSIPRPVFAKNLNFVSLLLCCWSECITYLMSKLPKRLKFWHCLVGLFTIWFIRVERVPYSNKFHLLFRTPKRINSMITQTKITDQLCNRYRKAILPPSNPKSIEVMSIVRDIAQAMHNGLELEKEFSIRAFAPNIKDGLGPSLFVGKSRDLGSDRLMKFGRRCSTKHLEGREWKVILVDDSYCGDNAMCPDGTMFIKTGNRISDEELAFTIAQQFGHAIARHYDLHSLETIGTLLLSIRLSVEIPGSLMWIHLPRLLLPIRLFFYRMAEFEADHIGMMLMASAGYNPQVAPAIYRKAEAKDGYSSDFFSDSPYHAKRARSLEKPRKMKLAMAVYKEALAAKTTKAYCDTATGR